jgi:hypothetical protein
MIHVPPLTAPLADHPEAERYERCAETDFPEEALYAVLCRYIARSPDLLRLLEAAPPTQRRAVLILAALHDQVLRAARPGQPPAGLADWYGSVGGQRSPADPALALALAAFATQHAATLKQLLATRRTQTNEVGRCAVLRPALDAIARRRGSRQLALFDFGCSAGLNLAVDRYGVDYRHAGGHLLAGVASGETPMLTCDWVSAQPGHAPPEPLNLTLRARAGTDLAPVDVHDDEAMRWLFACLWPGDAPRRQRLARAVQLCRTLPLNLHAADDGLAVLAHWLDSLPAGITPVLFNSWVLTYFTPGMLAAHTRRVLDLVQRRGLVWLSAEDRHGLHATTGLAPPAPPSAGPAADYLAGHTFWSLTEPGPDGPRHTLLARSHPHGRWLQWLAPEPLDTDSAAQA